MADQKRLDLDNKSEDKSDQMDKSISPIIEFEERSAKGSKKRIGRSHTNKKNRKSELPIIEKTQEDQSNNNPNSKVSVNKCKKITDFFSGSNKLINKQQTREQDISEWEIKYKEKQRELYQKEKEIQNLKKIKQSISTKYGEQTMNFQNFKKKAKDVLIKNLKVIYSEKRKEKQRPNRDLGYMKQTIFIEGRLILQNKQKLAHIKKKLQSLEQDKKKLRSNKSQDYQQQKQALQIRIEVLEKDYKQLLDVQKKLESEKGLYLTRNKLYNQQTNSKFYKQNWPLIKDRYQTLQLLGKGGFSQVYRCYDLDDNIQVALKLSYFNSDNTESLNSYMKHIVREYTTQKSLNHKNIAKLYQVIEMGPNTVATILQLCSGPDLYAYIKKYECLEQKQARFIVKQILSALNYMDSRNEKIIHYDLKPQNIMFHDGIIKIVDFGLCKIVDSNETRIQLTSQGTGTYWYLPPQTFQQNQTPKISNKVDIWSVGVIFYQMLYGKRPFGHGMSQNKIIKQGIISRAYNVQFATAISKKYKVSEQAKEFIRGCLQYSQQRRLSVNEACNHNYIKK